MSEIISEKTIKELIEQTKKLNEQVEKILQDKAKDNQETYTLSIPMMLALPDTLRKTCASLSKLRQATAEQIAVETHRTRAIESMYLNQLVVLGYIRKKKDGHCVIFYMESLPAAPASETSVSE